MTTGTPTAAAGRQRIMAYIACSLDGYIAEPDGGVEWLNRYFDAAFGTELFIRGIGVIVMGRKTFDDTRRLGPPPRMDASTFVLTHRPLPEDAPPEARSITGPVRQVAATLREEAARRRKDVWLMGGGLVIADFLSAGEVDALDLFLMPTLLRDGVPLFPPCRDTASIALALDRSQAFPNGVVRLTYTRAPACVDRMRP